MDKLALENYLLVLKSTVEVYVHGTLESSNKSVKECLLNHLNDIIECQEETYNKMTEFGFYKVNNVNASTIEKVLNKIKQN